MKSKTTNPCIHLYQSPTLTIVWHNKLNRIKKHLLRYLCKKYQSIVHTVVATLSIAGLFLAGAYFFLVQLATYGW